MRSEYAPQALLTCIFFASTLLRASVTFTFAAAIAVGSTLPLTGHWDLGDPVSASQDEVFQDRRHRTHFCPMNIFLVINYLRFLDANLSEEKFW